MRVTANQDRCCSSGQCMLAAPAVFDQRDEDGIVIVLDESPPESERAGVLQAMASCPTEAITVTDDSSAADCIG